MKPERNWDNEDEVLEHEFADVIQFIRAEQKVSRVPRDLNRKVLAYAKENQPSGLEKNWLLGQGPWVILVTLIAFTVLLLTLSIT